MHHDHQCARTTRLRTLWPTSGLPCACSPSPSHLSSSGRVMAPNYPAKSRHARTGSPVRMHGRLWTHPQHPGSFLPLLCSHSRSPRRSLPLLELDVTTMPLEKAMQRDGKINNEYRACMRKGPAGTRTAQRVNVDGKYVASSKREETHCHERIHVLEFSSVYSSYRKCGYAFFFSSKT